LGKWMLIGQRKQGRKTLRIYILSRMGDLLGVLVVEDGWHHLKMTCCRVNIKTSEVCEYHIVQTYVHCVHADIIMGASLAYAACLKVTKDLAYANSGAVLANVLI